MKVLDAKVNWMLNWANDPRLVLLVDESPKNFIYQKKGCLYFAEKEGIVRFFFYDGPGDGYSGRNFDITLDTGEEVTLQGPWSSRSGVMNNAGFTPSMEVHFTDSLKHFERGYTLYAGHVTVELAKKVVEEFLPYCRIIEENYHGEEVFLVALKDGRRKPEEGEKL